MRLIPLPRSALAVSSDRYRSPPRGPGPLGETELNAGCAEWLEAIVSRVCIGARNSLMRPIRYADRSDFTLSDVAIEPFDYRLRRGAWIIKVEKVKVDVVVAKRLEGCV